MQAPTPEFWAKLSVACHTGPQSEALLLAMQLFPGTHNEDLVGACVTAGEEARFHNDYYTAEWFYRLAITLYDQVFIDAHKFGLQAIKHLIQILEAQGETDESWRVIKQTEDLTLRAATALAEQVRRVSEYMRSKAV